MRLPANVRNLRIDYTALSLVAPEKVHFCYKLEGQNPNWHEVINQRQVFYTNLPPRDYRFRVMASNNSGVWKETGDPLEFSIAPAYYQTNWFRALLAAAFMALLWSGYQFRVRQLQQESRQLRDVVETIPAMARTALADGSNEFVDRRWAEYTGLSAEETAGGRLGGCASPRRPAALFGEVEGVGGYWHAARIRGAPSLLSQWGISLVSGSGRAVA